jgi:hypothetical protein
MKLVGVISTAVLSLALGVAAPAFAQDHEQDEQKAKPAQDEKQMQPEKPAAKPEERPAAQEEKNAKPEEKSAQQEEKKKPEEKSAQQEEKTTMPAEKNAQPGQHAAGNGGDRIPANRYKASFGQKHTFRVTQADYSNHRFAYGGYSFGFVDSWPSNWLYTQNVYVIEIDGMYYLCNPMYPGVNLALTFTL